MSAAAKSTPPKPFTCRSTKPGDAIPRPLPLGIPQRDDPAVGDLDVARHELPVDQRGFDAEPHRASIACAHVVVRARKPLARRRRVDARAARRSRPSRSRPPPRAPRLPAPAARRWRAARSDGHARAACRSSPRRRPSGSRGLAEADHRDGRDGVEHELLRGAGLQPGRAGDHLRADDDGDLALRELAERGLPRPP